MERRPRKGFSRLDTKKSSESATQQCKVADVDPHNYDVLETRHRQYPAKLTRSGQKWSVKFETRSAPVSPKDTSDLDTDEGQHITQQVLQTALEHERRLGRVKVYIEQGKIGTYMKKFYLIYPFYLALLRHCLKMKKKNLTVYPK